MLKHPVISFSIRLVLMLSFTFVLHIVLLQIMEYPLLENKIVASYIINTFLTIAIFYGLYLMRDKYSSQIGFLFLGTSLLKFAVFFIVFYALTFIIKNILGNSVKLSTNLTFVIKKDYMGTYRAVRLYR